MHSCQLARRSCNVHRSRTEAVRLAFGQMMLAQYDRAERELIALRTHTIMLEMDSSRKLDDESPDRLDQAQRTMEYYERSARAYVERTYC